MIVSDFSVRQTVPRNSVAWCARASGPHLRHSRLFGVPPPVAMATGGNPPSRHAPRAALPSILGAPNRLRRRRPTIAGSGKTRQTPYPACTPEKFYDFVQLATIQSFAVPRSFTPLLSWISTLAASFGTASHFTPGVCRKYIYPFPTYPPLNALPELLAWDLLDKMSHCLSCTGLFCLW